MSANSAPGKEQLSILPILGKLLVHHVRFEDLQQRETAERSRQYHGMRYGHRDAPHVELDTMRAEAERAVEGSAEFREKLAELQRAAKDKRNWPKVKSPQGRWRRARKNEVQVILAEAARQWALGRLLDKRLRERYGEEGLQPALPATPWQTAVQLLLGKYGLNAVLAPQGEPFDGDPDDELRDFIARWRLACRGPIFLGIGRDQVIRRQFAELHPGEKLQVWADKLDESGRTKDFLAEIRQMFPAEAAELGLVPVGEPQGESSQNDTCRVAPRRPLFQHSVEEPKAYLMNWPEILDAVGERDNQETRGRVRRLNNEFGGPIIITKRGGRPRVDKAKLLAWWNGLEDRFQELQQRQQDRQATGAGSYNHGRDGTVVPDLAGSVKRRRRDAKR